MYVLMKFIYLGVYKQDSESEGLEASLQTFDGWIGFQPKACRNTSSYTPFWVASEFS